jgi:Protein of unknown function (DUF4231)
MANESSTIFSQKEEEEKLVRFYKNVIDNKYEKSTDSQKEFLMQLLNTKITQIEPKVDKAKEIHYLLRISVLVFSAISTIILGLKFQGDTFKLINGIIISPANIALILTSIITFLSTLAIFWDIENYWVRLKISLNKLKSLRYRYVFEVMGEATINNYELSRFLKDFIAIQEDEYWENYFASLDKK